MNMLYDLVVRSSNEAAAFFYWRMHWSRPGLERYSFGCIPDNHRAREPYYVEAMISANAQTNIVIDTWNSPLLSGHLWSGYLEVGLGTGTTVADGRSES
jgi:hypothetical protein